MKRVLGLLALVVAAAACGREVDSTGQPVATKVEKATYGDTFIEALLGDISGLIPNITNDGASHDVAGNIYNGLVTYDREFNIVPEMAESWTMSDDCLDLTFKLRRNVKWHDGRPFTAEDVVFTHETMLNPKTPTAYREDFKQVERLEAVDPYTVHVHYTKPYAKALQTWTTWMLPKHRLESYVGEGKLREAPENRDQPVGTGPYRFQEWKPAEKVVLTANRDYYREGPYIARVVYRIIPSQATQFLELKAEAIDGMGLTALQAARQTDYPAFRKAYHKYQYAANAYTYFGMNLKDPRFADRRVRQAFAHAINKKELIEGVLLGLGREATGPYKPGSWAYNPKVQRYPYDLARARALLAEAGWKEKNAAGVLVKDGQPFTFELLTNQGNDERRKVAEIIQAALKEVGVHVEVRIIEWASLLKEYLKKKRFEAIVLGWGIGPDPDQYNIWHSSKTGPDELNQISYSNAEVDELLEKGRTSCQQTERAKYYHRLQEILAEDQPIVFLYFRDALPVVATRVHGVSPSANGIRYNFPEWFVPKNLQRYTAG